MSRPPPAELETVIDEVRLLWNALVKRGDRLHRRERLSMGMRAVLEFLLRGGPATVPAIARSRGVTRQHVQALANGLLEEGLVEAAANPAHRRSPLLRLTARGERTIGRMRQREAQALGATRLGVTRAELAQAAETLRRLRRAIGS